MVSQVTVVIEVAEAEAVVAPQHVGVRQFGCIDRAGAVPVETVAARRVNGLPIGERQARGDTRDEAVGQDQA